MFSVEKTSTRRLTLTLSEPLNADSVNAGITELLHLTEGIEHARLLYVVDTFRWTSVRYMLPQLRRIHQLLVLRRKISHVAVVAEARSLRRLSDYKGALVPGIQLRSFASRSAAERWLQSISAFSSLAR